MKHIKDEKTLVRRSPHKIVDFDRVPPTRLARINLPSAATDSVILLIYKRAILVFFSPEPSFIAHSAKSNSKNEFEDENINCEERLSQNNERATFYKNSTL